MIPASLPRRRELVAAASVAVVLAHLLLAPLTLLLAALFALASRATRWRLSWLLAPAGAGLAWLLVTGPDQALAGLAAGPAVVLRHLLRLRTAAPGELLAAIGAGLPRQLPAALPLAAAEAALLGWLHWLHTDEWAVRPPRPGIVAVLRAALAARRVRAGGVLTRDGCALGLVPGTGAVAGLRWAEMTRGVLVTGAGQQEVMLAGWQLVHAALRRRKPVIVLGPGPGGAVARTLAAACRATGVPLLPPQASLSQVAVRRAAVLLPAGSPEQATAAFGRLTALAAQLRRIGVDGDALVWAPQADALPAGRLAGLLRDGAPAGLSVLAGTTAPPAAASLAAECGTVLIRRLADPGLADALAAQAGIWLVPPAYPSSPSGDPAPGVPGLAGTAVPDQGLVRRPAVPARALLALGPDGLVLAVSGPAPRLVPYARLVPARLPPGAAP